MRPVALVSALLVARLGLSVPTGDSFDPSTASASELVLRDEIAPARPAPRSSGLKQATRAEVVNRLARRGRGGEKRQAATSPAVPTCIPDSTAASGTPKYAVFQGVQVANLGVSPGLYFQVDVSRAERGAWSVLSPTSCVWCLVPGAHLLTSVHGRVIADMSLPHTVDQQLYR
jgi:hypothetical protein